MLFCSGSRYLATRAQGSIPNPKQLRCVERYGRLTMDTEPLSAHQLHMLVAFVALLALIYVVIMYTCWGTLSLSTVQAEFKESRELDNRYESILQRREDMLYHIGASKQRGERDQALILERQLVKVEQDIDMLEERLQELDARRGGKRSKVKF